MRSQPKSINTQPPRKTRHERRNELCDITLQWLYERETTGRWDSDTDDLLRYLGATCTPDEVELSTNWLRRESLIEGEEAGQSEGLLWMRLTPSGQRLAESERSVATILEDPGTSITVTAHNSNVSVGSHGISQSLLS